MEKLYQGFGQECGEGVGYTDIEFSGYSVGHILYLREALVGGLQRLLRQGQQAVAGLGEAHVMAIALKEGRTHFVLQLVDLLTKG